jgi:hypothetical protein
VQTSSFVRYQVEVGSVMFFLSDQQHRAPRNDSNETRIVLFAVIAEDWNGKRSRRFDDGVSIFEFQYAFDRFGADSKECLDSLRRYYTTHNPLKHYRHMPQQAAKWRRELDPPFAKWVEEELSSLRTASVYFLFV